MSSTSLTFKWQNIIGPDIKISEFPVKLGRKKNRSIFISKTSGGKGIDVQTLNPKTNEGRENLEKFLTPVRRRRKAGLTPD